MRKKGSSLPTEGSPTTSFNDTTPGLIRWFLSTLAGFKALILLLIVIVAFIVGLHYFGYSLQFQPPYIVPTVGSMQRGELAAAISEGIQHRKPYIIESMTLLIRLEDKPQPGGDGVRRILRERAICTIRPLVDISAADMSIFQEHFEHQSAKRIDRWPGTEKEVENDPVGRSRSQIQYDVQFDAKKGVGYTLMTGAEMEIDLPMQGRETHQLRLEPNEDAVIYSNSGDDDIICQLLVVIESPHLRLRSVGATRIRPGTGGVRIPSNVEPAKDWLDGSVLSARWTNVRPGDKLIFTYSWDASSSSPH